MIAAKVELSNAKKRNEDLKMVAINTNMMDPIDAAIIDTNNINPSLISSPPEPDPLDLASLAASSSAISSSEIGVAPLYVIVIDDVDVPNEVAETDNNAEMKEEHVTLDIPNQHDVENVDDVPPTPINEEDEDEAFDNEVVDEDEYNDEVADEDEVDDEDEWP
nr:hypothetical protein [Tanacetum cinerariifolium]